MSPWQIMDSWCAEQCQKLLARTNQHIIAGRPLDDREFRRLLGQNQAFLKMRSFIHGSLASADTHPEGGNSTKIEVPFMSGAVAESETPTLHPLNPSTTHDR